MKVAFYGCLAEAVAPELEIEALPGWSVAELRDKVIAEHPQAGDALRSKRARACVGDAVVHDSYVLRASDSVEFLPPVSGG